MTWAKAWRRLARDYSGRIQGLVRETRWVRKQLAAAEAEVEKARADGISAVDATVRAAREEVEPASPSAPGPEVPEEVRGALDAMVWSEGRMYAEAVAAISRALATAREEALQEAREVLRLCEWADDDWCPVCGAGQFGDKVHRPGCRLGALLASPPPAQEGGR